MSLLPKDDKKLRKWVTVAYVIMFLGLILVGISITYRNYIMAQRRKEHHARLELAVKAVVDKDLQLALGNLELVKVKNPTSAIKISNGFVYTDYIQNISKRYPIEGFVFNTDRISFHVAYTEDGVERELNFQFHPSPYKFKTQVKDLDTQEMYALKYKSVDIKSGIDPIFDLLDLDDDGVLNVDFYKEVYKLEVDSLSSDGK